MTHRGTLHIIPRVTLCCMGSKVFSMLPGLFFSCMWCLWLPLISLWTCPEMLKIFCLRVISKKTMNLPNQLVFLLKTDSQNTGSSNYFRIPARACFIFLTPRYQVQLHLAQGHNGRTHTCTWLYTHISCLPFFFFFTYKGNIFSFIRLNWIDGILCQCKIQNDSMFACTKNEKQSVVMFAESSGTGRKLPNSWFLMGAGWTEAFGIEVG